MDKNERIERYGEAAWQKMLEQSRAWAKAHPEKVAPNNHEGCRRGGKYYERHIEYNHSGLQGERNKIRNKHGCQYRPFKMIIAPESQLHHEWIPQTAEYRGVALVEKEAHMHGFVDVIEILDGEITLRTEEEVKNGKKNSKEAN